MEESKNTGTDETVEHAGMIQIPEREYEEALDSAYMQGQTSGLDRASTYIWSFATEQFKKSEDEKAKLFRQIAISLKTMSEEMSAKARK